MPHPPRHQAQLPRRAVVAGTGMLAVAAALGACTSSGTQPAATLSAGPATPAVPPPATGASPPAAGQAEPAAPRGEPLASTSAIPVGGGTVFADKQVVVTQPEAGTFKAFSAICTHQGCTVNKVAAGTIDCPCHGSKYSITDGSVVRGPARRALAPRQVTVAGDELLLQ
jgi:Rieske Fe-S protein